MDGLSLAEVRRLVAAANAVRWRRDTSGSAVGSDGRRAERQLDDLFRTSHTLAVYGTPAPGQPNHHVLAPLVGGRVDGRPDRRGFTSVGMGRGPRLSRVPPSGRGRRRSGAGVECPPIGDRLAHP